MKYVDLLFFLALGCLMMAFWGSPQAMTPEEFVDYYGKDNVRVILASPVDMTRSINWEAEGIEEADCFTDECVGCDDDCLEIVDEDSCPPPADIPELCDQRREERPDGNAK